MITTESNPTATSDVYDMGANHIRSEFSNQGKGKGFVFYFENLR